MPVKLLREPLVHFLAVGVLLFLLFDLVPKDVSDDAKVIEVGDDELITLITYRNPRLTPEAAVEYLAAQPEEQRRELVEDFVREEVMYREAIALGLNENNYSARRRLIAQLEYINQGFIYETLTLTDGDLQAHYEENRERYYVVPKATFTHVYFGDRRDDARNEDGRAPGQPGTDTPSIQAVANTELLFLNANKLPFHKAASRGDHFLYHRNYVDKDQEEVSSHFGSGFAREVFALTDETDGWRGPFKSDYGYHLVLISSLKPGYYPSLDDVRARVADDVTRLRVEQELDRTYREVQRTYEIRVPEAAP